MVGVCFGCKEKKKIKHFKMKGALVGKDIILCLKCDDALFKDADNLKSDMRRVLGKE